jgi:(1->4)-alpha-D-glucan 1-alpha-D-glucosylmutase
MKNNAMQVPVSTYRLQLNAAFNFKQVADLLAYLHDLGITTIYASPFFAAPAGSAHGYNVCDSHILNSEIGTAEQLEQLLVEMRTNNMTWLQDVVPNHMVFAMTNQRLADVLERGSHSPYYKWFDIDWQHPDPDLHGKLMVPFLGKPLKECLKDNDLSLDICEGGLVIKYMDQSFPLSISAYEPLSILRNAKVVAEVEQWLQQLYTEAIRGWPLASWLDIKTSLVQSFLSNEQQAAALKQLLAAINADVKLLQAILQQQFYQLSWWQDANRKINYRRFFAVNELIATNMANEEVFTDYHKLLKELYEQKIIHGLRIDHIDGLQEPGVYLNKLRQLFGDDCYIVVEKILEQQESLPSHWPMQGTTGYEFSSQVSWLLTNQPGAKELVRYYQLLFPNLYDYKKITFEKKRQFLETYMVGEWDNLVRYLYTLHLVPDTMHRDELKEALALFMCCLPVYRLYPEDGQTAITSLQIITRTFEEAAQRAPELQEALAVLQSIWQVDPDDAGINSRRLVFQKRLMQFTGPLTAKGVEDTTFYVYNALLGHNEVGDTPHVDHYSVNEFHQWMLQRQQEYPLSLNATSTHDTKRGEDGRIRVNALTWFANYWQELVEHWRLINVDCKVAWDGQLAPMLQDEYFIYQSLVAGFPDDEQVTDEYITRLKDYFIKSVREAKLYTNWQQPDTAYEEAGCIFIEKILSPQHDFLNSFQPFIKSILAYARVFSLTQALLRITAPGIPDMYQGSELWNTSYVDPDNRRPVDFTKRKHYLRQLMHLEKQGLPAVYSYITCNRSEGLEKLYITWKALQCRKNHASLFWHGNYIPVYASVDCGIIAYARQNEQQWVLVVAPVSDNLLTVAGEELLANMYLLLPPNAPVRWKNEFTGETVLTDNSLPLHMICKVFPVALLTGELK